MFDTTPAEIPDLCKLVEPAFVRALAARDPEEVVAAVAEVHWWAANIMPFERGSAGAIDALAKADPSQAAAQRAIRLGDCCALVGYLKSSSTPAPRTWAPSGWSRTSNCDAHWMIAGATVARAPA